MSLTLSSDNPPMDEILAVAAAVRAAPSIIPNEKCDRATSVPSPSVPGRQVGIEIYEAPSIAAGKATRRPAVLNWHGSGFMVPRLGKDAYLARFLSKSLDVVFVDADYAKSPENPFPAGLHECIPAIKWTLSQPWFDGNLILCGLSAGATLACSISSKPVALELGLTEEEYSHIKATILFYPATDSSIPVEDKKTNEEPLPEGIPMAPLSRDLTNFFMNCYLGFDKPLRLQKAKDPKVSPAYADPKTFEPPLYIIACEHDPLGDEAKAFAEKVTKVNNKHQFYYCKGVGHGFETRIPELHDPEFDSAPGAQVKKECYERMLAFCKQNVPGLA